MTIASGPDGLPDPVDYAAALRLFRDNAAEIARALLPLGVPLPAVIAMVDGLAHAGIDDARHALEDEAK